jgi:succinyl-diaminopimelate desuccinylase
VTDPPRPDPSTGTAATVDPADAEPGLSGSQLRWYEEACSYVDHEGLRTLVGGLVSIPSPTGNERSLAEWIAARLGAAGVEADVQTLDDQQANAIGRLQGRDGGFDLLLYAPIDTHTTGRAHDDLPWVGEDLRVDMVPEASMHDDLVVGLGANNPKGHAACVVAAIQAVAAARVPLWGRLTVGLGAGGMPTTRARPAANGRPIGHGVGCAYMLDHGVRPDFAVIAKPSRGVLWEEVGLAWVRVTVRGRHGYVGTRHKGTYRNPIAHAAAVIDALESWFPQYTASTTDGLVEPQADIGAIQAGWTDKPAFVPARCDLYVDLRLNPRRDPVDSIGTLRTMLADLSASRPDLEIDVEPLVVVPGGVTDPDNWIVKSAIAAWEHVEGRPHAGASGNSGATDANILRGRGIPTARIGMPRVGVPTPVPDDFCMGMGVVDLNLMEQLVAKLIYVALDTCTRPRRDPR